MADPATWEDELAAELDRVQGVADYATTRIDKALALLDEEPGMELTRVGIKAVRDALEGRP